MTRTVSRRTHIAARSNPNTTRPGSGASDDEGPVRAGRHVRLAPHRPLEGFGGHRRRLEDVPHKGALDHLQEPSSSVLDAVSGASVHKGPRLSLQAQPAVPPDGRLDHRGRHNAVLLPEHRLRPSGPTRSRRGPVLLLHASKIKGFSGETRHFRF